MAGNKDKLMAAAQKYVERGQFDKAIKEYQKVVSEDSKDVRVWHKIADLHAKRNAGKEAGQAYERVASIYSEQGFYIKAVAVYKQILKLEPDRTDINLHLAELYKQLGLLSDAMQQFELAAGAYTRAGKTRESLQALRNMVEMDPNNIASRIKLAESYSKEGMAHEAVEEFTGAAEQLKAQKRIDDYIKVAERIAWHKPEDDELLKELAALYIRKSDSRRALTKLQPCFKKNPKDIKTLELLADAFQDLGQHQKTLSVLKELARVLHEQGQRDERDGVYRRILNLEPEDTEARSALGMTRKVTPAAPERSYPRSSSSYQPAPEQLPPSAFEELGIRSPAKPERSQGSRQRPLPNPPAEPWRPPSRAQTIELEPEEAQIDTGEDILDESSGHEVEVIPEEFEVLAEEQELAPEPEAHDVAVEAEEVIDARVEVASEFEETPVPEHEFDAPSEGQLEEDPDLLFDEAEPLVADADASGPSVEEPGEFQLPAVLEHVDLTDDLDETDFFLQQGLIDQAREMLEQLLTSHPGHPMVLDKLAQLGAAEQAGSAGEASVSDVSDDSRHEQLASQSGLLELSRRAKLEKQIGAEDYETHYDLGIAYKEMGLLDDAISEFQIAMKAPGKAVFCQTMMGLCYGEKGLWSEAISQLKKALYVEGITDRDELTLYYELGSAYEALQDGREAAYYFERVAKKDPRFRDVVSRLERAKSSGGPSTGQNGGHAGGSRPANRDEVDDAFAGLTGSASSARAREDG